MQVAMIVRDLEAAMKRHWETCKIGPWDIYQFEPGKVENYTYRDKAGDAYAPDRCRLERRHATRADPAVDRLQHL